MKLVYLDTSNFSLLAEVQQKSPERLNSFFKRWRDCKYILALSEANIFEIARNGFNVSRYNLLKESVPIRFEPHIFPKEIIKYLNRKGTFDIFIRDYNFCRPMFHEVICLDERLHFICNSSKNGYQILARQSYELSEISWSSKRNAPHDKKKKKVRLKDLLEFTSIEVKEYLEPIIKLLNKNIINHPGTEKIKFLYSLLEKYSPLQAYAKIAEININKESNFNKPMKSLNDRLHFKNSVYFFLSQIVFNNDKYIDMLANEISIEDCPGEWLKQQVEYQLEKSGDFETSNQLDIKHISHLPYVDILIADKRIVDKVNQVLRSNSLIPSLRKVCFPKRISNSIDSLEDALFNI